MKLMMRVMIPLLSAFDPFIFFHSKSLESSLQLHSSARGFPCTTSVVSALSQASRCSSEEELHSQGTPAFSPSTANKSAASSFVVSYHHLLAYLQWQGKMERLLAVSADIVGIA